MTDNAAMEALFAALKGYDPDTGRRALIDVLMGRCAAQACFHEDQAVAFQELWDDTMERMQRWKTVAERKIKNGDFDELTQLARAPRAIRH